MSSVLTPRPSAPAVATHRALGLVAALALLAGAIALSLAIGTRTIPLGTVWHELWHDTGSEEGTIVRDLRLPRTALGLLAGAALAVAGALMQALTRNALADPGVLGINAGAAAALCAGTAIFGVASLVVYVWFAFVGAALVCVLVYGLGATGRGGASPIRLALAGAAVAAMLQSLIGGMVLAMPATFDQYRFWAIGSLSGHPASTAWQVAGFVAVGLVLALALARPLNAIALGDDAGRALGVDLGRTRALAAVAVTLLCGAATAAVGPVAFVGLVVPHAARILAGPDQRWTLPYALVLGPALLLVADVLGRVVARPGELEAGLVLAVLGAPAFVALVRRRRVAQL